MKKEDFKASDFPMILDWNTPSLRENLQKIVDYAEGQAKSVMNWYFAARTGRRISCRICRFLAITLTAAAGIIPILSEAYPTWGIKPLYSTLSLSLAALWVAIDRFWGFTSGWVRYIQTGQQIANLLEAFRMEIAADKLSWNGSPLPPQIAKDTLTRTRIFIMQLYTIVSEETKTWAQDFNDALKEFDSQGKILTESTKKAAVQFVLTNGDQAGTWTIVIDGGPAESKSGKQSALLLFPGLHTLSVTGTIGGRNTTVEVAVDVKPGSITKAEATL